MTAAISRPVSEPSESLGMPTADKSLRQEQLDFEVKLTTIRPACGKIMNQAKDQGGIFERSVGERPSDRAIEKSSEQASTHTRFHCLCF